MKWKIVTSALFEPLNVPGHHRNTFNDYQKGEASFNWYPEHGMIIKRGRPCQTRPSRQPRFRRVWVLTLILADPFSVVLGKVQHDLLEDWRWSSGIARYTDALEPSLMPQRMRRVAAQSSRISRSAAPSLMSLESRRRWGDRTLLGKR